MELNSKILDYWHDASVLYFFIDNLLEHDYVVDKDDLECLDKYTLQDGSYYLSPFIIRNNIHPFLIPILVKESKIYCADLTVNSIIANSRIEEVLSGSYAHLLQQVQLLHDVSVDIKGILSFCIDTLSSVWKKKIEQKSLYFFSEGKLSSQLKENYLPKELLLANNSEKMTKFVTNEEQVAHASNRFCLTNAQKNVLDMLKTSQDKVTLVEGPYGAGITTILKNYAAQQLVNSIINEERMPVFYKFEKKRKRSKILFLDELHSWFTEEEILKTFGYVADECLKKKYKTHLKEAYNIEAYDILSTMKVMKSKIVKIVSHLKQGEVLKYSLDEINSFLSTKYQGYEGLKTKRNNLSINLSKFKEELKEVKVLLSFWQRQLMNIPIYYRKLCFIRMFSERIISKNRRYLLSAIDEDKLNTLALEDIEAEIKSKIQDITESIKTIEREISELESDRGNLISANSKYAVWQRTLEIKDSMSEEDKFKFLSTNTYNDIYNMVILYWFGMQLIKDSESIKEGDSIVIIENASMCPTFEIAKDISSSGKAILIKRSGQEEFRFIPEHIDDNLIYKHNLLSDEVDQEELQFLGVGASSGSIWRYFSEIIDDNDILKLPTTHRYSKEIANLLRKFDVAVSTSSSISGEIKIVLVGGNEENLVNELEACEIIDFYYSMESKSCVVLTTTLEQANYIKAASKGYMKVYTIEEYINLDVEYNDLIVSLVFNGESYLKPFEEKSFWQKILIKARDRLFIVCNSNMFGSFAHGCMSKFESYKKDLACIE